MPFPTRFLDHYRKADRIMLGLIWLMFAFAIGLAFWHDTFKQALLVGGWHQCVVDAVVSRHRRNAVDALFAGRWGDGDGDGRAALSGAAQPGRCGGEPGHAGQDARHHVPVHRWCRPG
ncbi:hypothetical protein EMIT0P258_110109 [Pseudomonas sp. IT-P258]